MSYEIKIPLFEGPFDLLLFFIERDELDIMDIPISEITNDFFEYISDLEKMNIEDLEIELGDEWHHESSHRLDGNFSVTDLKVKKGKVKKSGSKIVFIIKFDVDVTMEDIELDNSPDY